jgi:hypothetical protein
MCHRPVDTASWIGSRPARHPAAIGLFAVVIAAPLLSGSQALAQDRPVSVPAAAANVQVQADGRFTVSAANVPLDEIIRAVAAAAGLQVTAVGQIPRRAVTVLFPERFPEEILAALMNREGISYVLIGGATRRLYMTQSPSGRGAPPAAVASVASPSPAVKRDPVFVTKLADDSRAQEPDTSESESAKETPPIAPHPSIEPANPGGAAHLPATMEALFLEVNGSVATTMPPGFTPNAGPPVPPDQVEPVNPVKPAPPPLSASGATSKPGVVAPPPPGATAVSGPPAPPDPAMMKAPQSIQIPGPVEVKFPPKPGQR